MISLYFLQAFTGDEDSTRSASLTGTALFLEKKLSSMEDASFVKWPVADGAVRSKPRGHRRGNRGSPRPGRGKPFGGGFCVHSVTPRQLDRFRDRFCASGAKDFLSFSSVKFIYSGFVFFNSSFILCFRFFLSDNSSLRDFLEVLVKQISNHDLPP